MEKRGGPDHRVRQQCVLAMAVLGVVLPGLAGCVDFIDKVSSRDFKINDLFARPSPLVVLLKSEDGNKRAEALASLREPLQKNPSAQREQDMYIQILTTSVTADQHPLCRLAAVRALGHFKDPRAAEALDRAFLETNQFTPDMNNLIRQEALVAMGQTGSSVARDRLVRVVREPPPAADTSDSEKQEALDRRLTAIRALKNFNNYEVAETLVKVLETEKDTALRDRAHESLVAVTGKKLPPDPKAWEQLLQQPANRDGDTIKKPATGWATLVGWWH